MTSYVLCLLSFILLCAFYLWSYKRNLTKTYTNMQQHYDRYTPEDFEVWARLFDRQMDILPGRASQAFLQAVQTVGFTRDRIPHFGEVNQVLQATTGWQLEVVAGLLDNQPFFNLLENKRFPATTWLRKLSQLDYLEEPDMFHDVFGHVPLLTDPNFCGFLNGLSRIALQHIENEWAIELISRLYWYTVEFGLIEDQDGLRIYGAGILSSSGESVYCLGNQPLRVPYNVSNIMATPYIKDRFQEKYWIIESFEQLYLSVPEVEKELDQILEKDIKYKM